MRLPTLPEFVIGVTFAWLAWVTRSGVPLAAAVLFFYFFEIVRRP